MRSPLVSPVVFQVGPVPFTEAVVTTWAIVAVLALASWFASRRLSVEAPSRRQLAVEAIVATVRDQIQGVVQHEPTPYVPLVGTLFVFVAVANLSSLIPGVHAPTATIETPMALAIVVFFAVHGFGIRDHGLWGYLKTYVQPNPLMLPLRVLSEFTRVFSLMVRLFGNMMSHEFILGIVVGLAGLLVPIPFMALGVVIGLIQAYIFAILAAVFIGAAVESLEAKVKSP